MDRPRTIRLTLGGMILLVALIALAIDFLRPTTSCGRLPPGSTT